MWSWSDIWANDYPVSYHYPDAYVDRNCYQYNNANCHHYTDKNSDHHTDKNFHFNSNAGSSGWGRFEDKHHHRYF